jgi:cystathionine beta-lyase
MKVANFEQVINRKNTGSAKWDALANKPFKVPDTIVPLSVADMEFYPPGELSEGLAEFARHTVFGYTAPKPEYFAAVCNWFSRRHHWEVQKDWIIPYGGVVPALYSGIEAVTAPGDGVILFTPVYYPFYSAVEQTGRKIIRSPLTLGHDYYQIDFSDFEQKAKKSENTALLLCNPHNPVGRVWTKSELERVCQICKDNGVTVISDEIHGEFVFPDHSYISVGKCSYSDQAIICTAPSKTFNIAGIQVSNIIIPNPELRGKFQAASNANGVQIFLNCFAYEAGTIVYNSCEYWLDSLLEHIVINSNAVRDYIQNNLPEIHVMPSEGTYLSWLDFRGLKMDRRQLEDLLNEAYLFLDHGYIFGEEGEGFERINLACATETLIQALERLQKAIRKR